MSAVEVRFPAMNTFAVEYWEGGRYRDCTPDVLRAVGRRVAARLDALAEVLLVLQDRGWEVTGLDGDLELTAYATRDQAEQDLAAALADAPDGLVKGCRIRVSPGTPDGRSTEFAWTPEGLQPA